MLTPRLGLYEKSMPNSMSLPEKLRQAKEAEFDFLDLSVDETEEKLSRLAWSTGDRRALVSEMFEAGIGIETMCLSGHRRYPLGSDNPAEVARGLEIMAGAVDLSADLGIRIIQLAGYDVYYSESTDSTRQRFADNLALSVEMAAARGVILAFETMEPPFMNTVAKAMRLVRLIDSPYLQVYPDLGNITNAARATGTDEFEDLRSGKGHLAAIHMKETVPGKYREIPYGTGHVNFAGCIREGLKLGVRLFVAEFWATKDVDWRAQLARARAFFREQFRKANE